MLTEPFAWTIQAPDEIQERAFPGAGWTHESKKFTLRHREVEARKHVDLFRTTLKDFLHVIDVDEGSIGCSSRHKINFGTFPSPKCHPLGLEELR